MSDMEDDDLFENEEGAKPLPPEPEESMDPSFEVADKLNKDLKTASKLLKPKEARFLSDFYYQIQDNRKRNARQVEESKEIGEPNKLLDLLFQQNRAIERNIKRALDIYTDEWLYTRWMKSIRGIAQVLSAGFTGLDIRRAPTCCHYWSYAGLNPNCKWLGKEKSKTLLSEILDLDEGDVMQQVLVLNKNKSQTFDFDTASLNTVVQASKCFISHPRLMLIAKRAGQTPYLLARKALLGKKGLVVTDKITKANLETALARIPWNAQLHTLCWKLAKSFHFFSNKPDDIYGHLLAARHARDTERNEQGHYRQLAEETLAIKKFKKDTDAYGYYSQGKLPKARILLMAYRYSVKIFLSHLHHVMWVDYYGDSKPVPKPYVFSEPGNDHKHYIQPPHFPFTGGGRSLQEFYAAK